MIEIILIIALAVWVYNKFACGKFDVHEWEYKGETYGYTSEFKQCKKCGKRKIVSMD